MNELSKEEVAHLVVYGLIGLYLAGTVIRLFRGRFTTGLLQLAVWAAALLAVITAYSYRTELQGVAERVLATVVPGTPIASGTREVTILRAADGGFLVRGSAGGVKLPFILDTGASAVVLRAEDAARLGIDTRSLAYGLEVATANGRALAATYTLPELSVGPLRETQVPVLIARPGTLHENLLGMTFLDRLASFSVTGNKLILRGR